MRAKDSILFSSETPQESFSPSGTPVAPLSRRDPERLFPQQPECSELTVRCRRNDYSASAIARAVEDCDAHLINLNVTSLRGEDTDDLLVDLRINHRNALSVARSLERYGYEVVELAGLDADISDAVRDRIDQLMMNLDI